ncbi:MAG: class I SAM-dependent methyltransferase [Mucinivorans sp.]
MDTLKLETSTWGADYQLLDSGTMMKLERFGTQIIARPEPQALWEPSLPKEQWAAADATFIRSANQDRGQWRTTSRTKEQWWIEYQNLKFRLGLTAFKHVGVFPEQASNWDFAQHAIKTLDEEHPQVLNMFAYTGGASMAAAKAGAMVTHVDSVKAVNTWARENAEASGILDIRYITDDATKFAERQVRRGTVYRGIVLDPPAYGRGPNGEKWILEEDLPALLVLTRQLLSPKKGSFLILNLYSMGFSALLAETLVRQIFTDQPSILCGELYATDSHNKRLPLGIFLRLTI